MILGIDPGSRIAGYGIIQAGDDHQLTAIDWGIITPPTTIPLNERIGLMAESIQALIRRYSPSAVAIESQFIHLNPQSALKLGLVRGAILLAARNENVASFHYSPSIIKKRASGSGRASKQQMLTFMASTFDIDPIELTFDSADALATAYCHWRESSTIFASKSPQSSPSIY